MVLLRDLHDFLGPRSLKNLIVSGKVFVVKQ